MSDTGKQLWQSLAQATSQKRCTTAYTKLPGMDPSLRLGAETSVMKPPGMGFGSTPQRDVKQFPAVTTASVTQDRREEEKVPCVTSPGNKDRSESGDSSDNSLASPAASVNQKYLPKQ